jgi:hypothetical protein
MSGGVNEIFLNVFAATGAVLRRTMLPLQNLASVDRTG